MAVGKTLTVYLAADLKNFNRGMDAAGNKAKSFGNTMASATGPALALAAAAGAAVAAFIGDSIKSATNLAETQNKVGVIFGDSARMVTDFAENAVLQLGQTENQALSAAATFAQFGKSAGLANQDLANFSTQLVTLATDLASFNNTSPEQAITAIGAALRGESEPLRSFGVLLDDATLKARAMEMGIYKGSGTLTQQQKVLAAHKEILAQTTDAQGDFSRTSDGLANTQKILTSAIEDAKAEIGVGLVNAIEDSISVMGGTEGMANLIDIMATRLANMTRGVGDLVAKLDILLPDIDLTNNLMEDLDENTESATNKVVELTLAATNAVNPIGLFTQALEWLGIQARETDELLTTAYDSGIALAKLNRYNAGEARKTKQSLIDSAYDSGIAHAAEADRVERLTKILGHAPGVIEETTEETERLTGSRGASTAATDKQARAEAALTNVFEIQSGVVADLATKLETERGKLQEAVTAMNDYAASMQANILSGLNLGQAFTNQFDETGKMTGEGVLQGFQKMVDQADWFGNVLVALKAQKVDDSLIQYIASQGPEVGGALGQQMLGDKGLLSSLNENWVAVQERTKSLSMQLVPEFMVAGVESGIEMVNGLADQLGSETQRLGRIGALIAKPVGARFKAQLLEDIAAAIREAQAFQSAARAEASAAAASRAVPITEQSAAQALSNLLRNSDQRNGQNIQPVLI